DVSGILTERDLLRATAAGAEPGAEPVRRWITANPEVFAPVQDPSELWTALSRHQFRHAPVVDHGTLVGVVSLSDLVRSGLLGPPDGDDAAPAGLEGVVVASTAVGDVHGREGFYHYRQFSAVDLAEKRSFEHVWFLLLEGRLPSRDEATAFSQEVATLRTMPPGLAELLAAISRQGKPLD